MTKLNNSIHLMLDLETASTQPNAAIVALGTVVILGDSAPSAATTFYQKSYLGSAEQLGCHIDKATMEWWNKQAEATRLEAFSGTQTLPSLLEAFYNWCHRISSGHVEVVHIWGNGADFDPVVLRSAYETHRSYPFNFRNHRCYRTLREQFPAAARNVDFSGFRHNALDDAMYQAKVLEAIAYTHGLELA